MNALTIAQTVYKRCGLHGTLESFEAPVGPQQVATVEAVKEAWAHIQTLRTKWTFMDSYTTFTTTSGITSYATSAIMSGASEDNLDYIHIGGVIYNRQPLSKVDWRAFLYVDNSVPAEPNWYTWEDATSTLFMNIPDGAYDITVRYHMLPQELSAGSATPRLPTKYHYLIVYEALQEMATYLGNDEVYTRYSTKHDEMLGELMRNYIPSETLFIPQGFV